jgi:hypothetical protein
MRIDEVINLLENRKKFQVLLPEDQIVVSATATGGPDEDRIFLARENPLGYGCGGPAPVRRTIGELKYSVKHMEFRPLSIYWTKPVDDDYSDREMIHNKRGPAGLGWDLDGNLDNCILKVEDSPITLSELFKTSNLRKEDKKRLIKELF